MLMVQPTNFRAYVHDIRLVYCSPLTLALLSASKMDRPSKASRMIETTETSSGGRLLWTPDETAQDNGQLADFATLVKLRHGFDWEGDFQALWIR